MSKRDAKSALTGLFGAYGSDDDAMSGSGNDEEGVGLALLGGDGEEAGAGPASSEGGSDDQPALSSLLSPSHMPEVASVAQLAPAASEPLLAGASDEDAGGAEAAQRSAGTASMFPAARLPPELAEAPPGDVDPVVKARVAQLCRAKADTGKRLTAELRRMRAYKNPDFLQKMVLYHGVDDRGTNFAPDVFDPRAIPKEDYYQALAKEWDAEYQRRIAERNKAGPQFTRGAPEPAKKLPYGLGNGGSQAAIFAAQAKAQALASSAGAKRSKWDTVPKR